MAELTVHEFLEAIRRGAYTSPGCYPLFFVTADGGVLSFKAARANVFRIGRSIRDKHRDGWRVVAVDVNWEDADLYCDDTGERIESAYAEPDEPDEHPCSCDPDRERFCSD